jgi:uncharacterized protein (TIGR02001 family)
MSMKTSLTKTVGAASIALLTLAGAASAEERKLEWSASVAGTSDYIFRGISTNNEDPAFQASVGFTYGIFYASLWGSNVTLDPDDYPAEVDVNFGITPSLGPVTFDIGGVWYTYPADGGIGPDAIEFKFGASYSPFTNFTVTPVFWYAPDQDNLTEAYTYEATAAYELPKVAIFTPTLSGLVGYSDIQATDADYTYWNVGLALGVENFTFDFRYWDTDLDNNPLADERFVFTASVSLP